MFRQNKWWTKITSKFNAGINGCTSYGLFTNIPKEDGIECLEEALLECNDKDIPSGLITKLMKLILKNHIFTFNSEYFKQEIGATMG